MDPNQHHNALNRNDMLHWYEIQSILGQGGFGITYLALDKNLDQLVAIKEYLPSEFSTRDQASTVQPISENHTEIFDWGKKRFLDEAKTLAQFRHPNVVRVSSFFENNNTGYMVMEYEDGTDLSKLIKAGENFDEQRLLGLLLPVLDGLDKIHEQGFIHRDIKPANIFIRTDGSPVLIDFGSARQAIGEQTKTMTSLVTPGYAPFEQYHDAEGKQGPWTDIYSLGATSYCMLTGKPPMDALKRGMARLDHSTDAYLPLVDLRLGDYSEPVLQAIDHALEFKETDRPQTVAEWSAMLRGELPVPQSSVPTRLGADAITANDGDTQRVTSPGEATRSSNNTAQPVTSPDAVTVTAPTRTPTPVPATADAQAAPAPPPVQKSPAKTIAFVVVAIAIVLAAFGWYSQMQKPAEIVEVPATQGGDEEARLAAEKEALRQAQARLAAEAKKLKEEKARVAEEQKQLEADVEREHQLRLSLEQEALRQEQARLAEEAKKLKEEKARVDAEEKQLLADSEREQQLILALEQEAAEQKRIAAEKEAAEQARLAAEKKAQEQARLAAEEEKRKQEQARLEAERKRKAEIAARAAAEQKRKAELAAQQAAEQKRLAELAAQQAAEAKRQQDLASQQAEQEVQLREQALQDAARDPYGNVSGSYRPEEGFEELTLVQIGNRVSGEVGTRGSTIEGRREGDKISFVLKYSRTGYGFKEGFGQFTISADGRRLTGFRSEAGFPPNSTWNFRRKLN